MHIFQIMLHSVSYRRQSPTSPSLSNISNECHVMETIKVENVFKNGRGGKISNRVLPESELGLADCCVNSLESSCSLKLQG